ncbi:MAG: serine hydrolase domain-containing protein [Candidatus Tumulicola sp.]
MSPTLAPRGIVRSLAIVAVFAQLALQSHAAGAGTVNDPHIGQVERGLQPEFYLAGEPRTTYTLAERLKFYHVPAVSIAVIDNYRVVWARGYGFRDVADRAPANATTLFQAASMSKPVFAAAALRLFEQRKLDLDADVNSMLHSWKVPPPPGNSTQRVTLRRTLNHTAGTNVHGFGGYDRSAPIPTLVQVLDGSPPANSEPIRVVKLPGGPSKYSGGGTTIGQQLAIDLTDQSFPDFMQQTLLGPLGMTNSTFQQPLPEPLWPRAATGYHVNGAAVYRSWHVYPEMAAAGLWTTASDLATFVIAIQNALRGETGGPITGHNGGNEGFQGEFVGLIHGGRGLVILTNSDNGIRLAREIVHSVAVAYGWPVLSPKPKTALTRSIGLPWCRWLDSTLPDRAATASRSACGSRAQR